MSRLLGACDFAAEPPERYRHDIFDRGFESDLTDVNITAVNSSVMCASGWDWPRIRTLKQHN
jgi:hypothetical protein